jgi:UMF1 family MFS transporter
MVEDRTERRRRRKEIFVWTLYDFANTSFSVIIVTVVFAVYFKQYIVGDHTINFFGEKNPGDFYWGLCSALSMLFVGMSSPFLGAIADYTSSKKAFLTIYTLLCIASMIAMYYLRAGMIWQAMLLFILGNIGFEGANVFYNGFLPQISNQDNIGRISGYGFAFGYVGSLASLAIALPYAQLAEVKKDVTLIAPTFVWAGIFFLVFSTPFYFIIREKIVREISGTLSAWSSAGWNRLRSTIREIKKFPQIVRFLIAYFVYIDGVNTVIYFAGIYASDTLQFSKVEVIQFFLIVQSSAISGSFIFGFLTDKLGPKKTIAITLLLWTLVVIGGFFSADKASFYLVGLIAGVAMGSSQAASRALMGQLIPEGMEAEFYGFYAMMGKFSAVLGPLVFGVVSTLTGSQRIAVLSLLFFFLIGYLLLRRVDEKETYRKVTI